VSGNRLAYTVSGRKIRVVSAPNRIGCPSWKKAKFDLRAQRWHRFDPARMVGTPSRPLAAIFFFFFFWGRHADTRGATAPCPDGIRPHRLHRSAAVINKVTTRAGWFASPKDDTVISMGASRRAKAAAWP